MSKITLLLVGFLFLTSCSDAQVKNSPNNNQEGVISQVISAKDFKNKMEVENIQLIDVRTPDEHNAGKIGDASNMDYYADDFKAKLETLDKSQPVMVYCASGGRSGKTANMMKSMGFKEVYDLSGGYKGWPFADNE